MFPVIEKGSICGVVSRGDFTGIEIDRLDEEEHLWECIRWQRRCHMADKQIAPRGARPKTLLEHARSLIDDACLEKWEKRLELNYRTICFGETF